MVSRTSWAFPPDAADLMMLCQSAYVFLRVRSVIVNLWLAALFEMTLNCTACYSLAVYNTKFNFEWAFMFCPRGFAG